LGNQIFFAVWPNPFTSKGLHRFLKFPTFCLSVGSGMPR